MPYSDNGYRPSRNSSSRGGRPDVRSERPGDGRRSSSSRPMQAGYGSDSRRQRNLPYKSRRNARTMLGSDAGLNVRRSYGGRGAQRRGAFLSRYDLNGRSIAILCVGLLGLLLVLFLVGSCVRGCSPSQPEQTGDQKAVNSYDSRVSSGASGHLTNEFTPQLNRSEKLAWIAQNADRYADERLPELALLEPEATDFVASVPDSDKKSADYTDSNEVGTYPLVYNWDARWGYVEYAGSNVGVNGSGLAALFMARAGLTGKTDLTPASLAADATSGGYTDETLGTAASFFTGKAADYGVAVKEYTPSGDNLKTILSEGSTSIALVQLKANFTTPYAHWALVVSLNSDGSVSLYDPASASASMRPWAAGTIGANCDGMYQLTRGEGAVGTGDSPGGTTTS